jgi:hypothetical protein
MVELQIVILAVAGSSPVGHPRFAREIPSSKTQAPKIKPRWTLEFGFWVLGFPPPGGVARSVLKLRHMLNPAVIDCAKAKPLASDFWFRIVNDEQLQDCDDLQKLVIGCEIIAALDAVDLLAA